DRRRGQRWLKQCHAPHQHGLACVSNTREQVLRSRAQLDTIWQRVWAKLRQHNHDRPAWQQSSRASTRKEVMDSCEEPRIYLANVLLRAGWRGRHKRGIVVPCVWFV